jgi:hypothetical protein
MPAAVGAVVDPAGHGREPVGRAVHAAVSIPSRSVRRHARIQIDGTRAVLEDLQSRNGTFVGGRRIEARRSPTATRSQSVGAVLVFLSGPARTHADD